MKRLEDHIVLSETLEDDGTYPNSSLPVLIYRNVFPDAHPGVIEDLFEDHDWTNSWRNGIHDFHHYHSNSHEVLGIYSGNATVQLGGPDGSTFDVEKGDVIIIPAGVAHKNMGSSADFHCVGAYPAGKEFDMNYGKSEERPEADKRISATPIPATDPVFGNEGALHERWSG